MDEMVNGEINAILEALKGLADIDESALTDEVMDRVLDNVKAQFSPTTITQSVNQIVKNLEEQGLNKAEAKESMNALVEVLKELVYGEQVFTGNKKVLVDTVMNTVFDIFNNALEKYHNYSINLPIMLEEGAHAPTYAHDSDACADMYAMEDITIPAHFYGTPVKTGVHIQLPEGWVAMLFPRSSIGAKTPLRLSNSVGIIDSGYRGEIRALYDNTSDEPYQIHKGDRIAQLMIMPSHRFKANIVDTLEDSDRGESGFGSTGT